MFTAKCSPLVADMSEIFFTHIRRSEKTESPRGGASRYAGGCGGLPAPRQGVWGAGSPPVKVAGGLGGGSPPVKTFFWPIFVGQILENMFHPY